MWIAAAACAAAAASSAGTLAAQDVASRVAAVRDGRVQLTFTGREGVCGDGRSFIRVSGSFMGEWNDHTRARACEPGPVRVVARVRGGVVDELHAYVGPVPASREADVTDLGGVPAPAAARWLLGVARTADGRAATRAIMPAVLADSADVWRDLLAVARDSATRAKSTRRDAAFWLSRFASAVVEGRKAGELPDDDRDDPSDDVEVKKSAVFALSQLRGNEGVPQLVTVARTNKEPAVRQQALFWLGQSGDPRGLALFEELLSGGRR